MIGVGRKRRRHDGDKLAVNLRDGSERGWLTPEDISKHRHTFTFRAEASGDEVGVDAGGDLRPLPSMGVLTLGPGAPLPAGPLADVDVVDVFVGLQSEDEADEVCDGQQHGDGVHQRPCGKQDIYYH